MQYNITYRKKDKGIQYIISYKDENGKWKQKSKQGFLKQGLAKVAAQEAVKELEKNFQSKSVIDPEYEGVTFSEFTKAFIEHEKLYKEWNTIRLYLTSFDKFKDLDDKKLSEITSLDIQKCVDNLVKLNLKNTTIGLYLAKMHTAFNYAINHKVLAFMPIKNIEILVSKVDSNKKALTKQELNDLLSKIKNRNYYMISLIASKCGLRLGEILGLTWDDIDEVNRTISVNKQWKKLKDGTCNFGELKSVNSNRIVPIPVPEKRNINSINVMAEIKKYKEEFPINYDKRLFHYKHSQHLTELLSDVYKKAGYNISIHELRHTYATGLIASGIDFKTVAYFMGHDVKQTIDTYSHVTNDMLKNATAKINKNV